MNLTVFYEKIRSLVGHEYFITNNLEQYQKEWRNRYSFSSIGVVLPNSVSQIQNIVTLCQEFNVAIVPQGGNTSLCIQAIPNGSNCPQLILNLKRLNKIIEVNQCNSSIKVEAGCILSKVQQVALQHDLYFPLSIGSEGSSQIGGNIATNAGGIHVLKYGMMRDLVLGLKVVDANGRLINMDNSLRKVNTNFDLKQLYIGSEGTLGIIVEANLKLFNIPKQLQTCLIGVATLNEAVNILNILKKQSDLFAFEIINQKAQMVYNLFFKNNQLPVSDSWLILCEVIAPTADVFYSINNDNIIIATNEIQRRALWLIRENIPLAEKKYGIAVKHDISLPIDKINDFVTQNQNHILDQYPEAELIIFGHLGDGNLHYNVKINNSNNDFRYDEQIINNIVYTDVYKYNGSFSAEHGIGMLKAGLYKKYTDINSYFVAYNIKKLLDPNNLFNPSKIYEEK